MVSLRLWPLVDVKVSEGNGDQAEELVDAEEVPMQHGQDDLRRVALLGYRAGKKAIESASISRQNIASIGI